MKISEIISETTSAGAIATVATPVGGMQKRPNPSVFSKKKKKKTTERKLSKAEIKKRDEYADDLPDAEFKKRYGDDWEAVKYGTATKMAKKKTTEAHPNNKVYDKCWKGYKKVPGKKRGEKGSCVKK